MNKTKKKQKQEQKKMVKEEVVTPCDQKPERTRDAVLRFSPYAWAKLIFMRDAGDTEVGGYGITGTDDPMLVTDFMLVKQECTGATFEFDEKDSIDFLERMMDHGLAPWKTQNVLIHTHPGNDPTPSGTDEDNFDKNFSHPHWAIFFILAKEGKTYCRIRHNVGPGIEVELDCEIDYSGGFPKSNLTGWQKEYDDNVTETQCSFGFGANLPQHYQGKGKSVSSLSSSDVKDEDLLSEWEKENLDETEKILAFEREFDGEPVADQEDLFIEDGQVRYWDDDKAEYFVFDPETNGFLNLNSLESGIREFYVCDPEPDWMRKVRQFARENLPTEKVEVKND
jgi:proteasome lid subunit RPN8/RPN11